jgi:hypothetical protein
VRCCKPRACYCSGNSSDVLLALHPVHVHITDISKAYKSSVLRYPESQDAEKQSHDAHSSFMLQAIVAYIRSHS